VYSVSRHHDHTLLDLVILAILVVSTTVHARDYTPKECPAIGNSATRIYHVSEDPNYREMLIENKNAKRDNRMCFKSSRDAEKAGYRKSRAGMDTKPNR
jgi:hypothetical protein